MVSIKYTTLVAQLKWSLWLVELSGFVSHNWISKSHNIGYYIYLIILMLRNF